VGWPCVDTYSVRTIRPVRTGTVAENDTAALESLLELLGDVHGMLDIVEFRAGLLQALMRMVPAEWASLNDLGADPADAVIVIEPGGAPAEDRELFARLAHENPLILRYQRTQDGRAYRFSDVTTPAALRRTELYQRIYAPMGVEHQIAFTLPAAPDRLLGIALCRGHDDFSDAERDLLNRARPFLIQAYRNAVEYSRVAGQAVRAETPRGSPDRGAATVALLARGLTSREVEVLWWSAVGQSPAAIAQRLQISRRTVQKHLERAYRKLGVANRSDAAAAVWSATA
jgi:DNA-binding CsgD family transcriptional regulator